VPFTVSAAIYCYLLSLYCRYCELLSFTVPINRLAQTLELRLWLNTYGLPELELGLMVGVTGRQGMLTPPRHLIPPLVYPEVRVCTILKFLFPTWLMRLMTVRYLCYFTKVGLQPPIHLARSASKIGIYPLN
jgi:hypothetical protein